MTRNLVLFFDGTGNEVENNLTNVLKLYHCTLRDADQQVFYFPGVGTEPRASDWGLWRQWMTKMRRARNMITGWGFEKNIIEAYCRVAREYREGDHIFIFGFSRGAYTARAVAGMIYLMGLLEPEQTNLAPYVFSAFKFSNIKNDLNIARNFRDVVGYRPIPIHFVGVWDTVKSVIRTFLPLRAVKLPYTNRNPSVRTFRQAAAIDERRRLFPLSEWNEDECKPDERSREPGEKQSQKTVWFAGTHVDVGGGSPENESQLSKIPLIWMTREAQACGLRIDQSLFSNIAEGTQLQGKKRHYPPDPLAPIHNSMNFIWWLMIPKPRKIENCSFVHSSVSERIKNSTYNPVNLRNVAYDIVEDTKQPANDAN